jgi:hypothetical protein
MAAAVGYTLAGAECVKQLPHAGGVPMYFVKPAWRPVPDRSSKAGAAYLPLGQIAA